MTSVDVIIPNYNGMKFIKSFLRSLKNQSYINKVIIIDNNSQDESVNYIKNNYSEFTLIQNKENLGFATAINQGITLSKSEYVFLLNNDTELDTNCISNLVKCIEKDDKIFAASCKMIQYNNRDKIDNAGGEYTLFGWTKLVGYGKSINKYNQEKEIFSACAGAALYRKSILNKIGLFDENFFAYMEDGDISYRARINGYKSVYCPKAVVYHIGSATSGSRYNEFKIRLAARNNVYVPLKNMPLPQLAINSVFLLIGFFIKYLFFLRLGYGNVYLGGLKEGFNSRKKLEKVKYSNKNLLNYLKIEWLLFKNIFKFY